MCSFAIILREQKSAKDCQEGKAYSKVVLGWACVPAFEKTSLDIKPWNTHCSAHCTAGRAKPPDHEHRGVQLVLQVESNAVCGEQGHAEAFLFSLGKASSRYSAGRCQPQVVRGAAGSPGGWAPRV